MPERGVLILSRLPGLCLDGLIRRGGKPILTIIGWPLIDGLLAFSLFDGTVGVHGYWRLTTMETSPWHPATCGQQVDEASRDSLQNPRINEVSPGNVYPSRVPGIPSGQNLDVEGDEVK